MLLPNNAEGPEDPEDPEDPRVTYTDWCAKIGTQLWLRLNFLTSSVKNFDTAIFARFVYSFNPYENVDKQLVADGFLNYFKEESWQFGVTLTYCF